MVDAFIGSGTTVAVADRMNRRWVGIDATKYAINATQWMDTGIEVNLDDELTIAASGQVDLMVNGGGGYATGPTGNAQWGQAPGTNHPPGALLGKIGNGGQTFLIGENYKGPAKAEGKLFLQISPSPWARHGNAVGGSYKVNITGGRDTEER